MQGTVALAASAHPFVMALLVLRLIKQGMNDVAYVVPESAKHARSRLSEMIHLEASVSRTITVHVEL